MRAEEPGDGEGDLVFCQSSEDFRERSRLFRHLDPQTGLALAQSKVTDGVFKQVLKPEPEVEASF